ITMTSRLRLRPAVPREIIPTAAPMIASGMISQFSQPSSGMKATNAQISATKPMISEARLNIGPCLASFGWLRQPLRPEQRRHVQTERDPDRRERNCMRARERLTVEQHGDQELE